MNLNAYPHPLAIAWNAVEQELIPFIRLHRAFDAFETLVRYCAAITLCSLNTLGLNAENKKELVEKMERPSLGIWVNLLRMTVEMDQRRFVRELGGKRGFLKQHIAPCTQGESDLVGLRNSVIHGGFISNETAQEILTQVEPRVLKLYEEAGFLSHYPLVAVSQGQQAIFAGARQMTWYPSSLGDGLYLFPKEADASRSSQSFLNLFPLQAYRQIFKWSGDDPQPVEPSPTGLFYARLQKRHLEYQSYEGHVSQDPEARKQFMQVFPLDQWRQELATANKYAFVEQRQQLLSGFDGREEEINTLRRWAENEVPRLFLHGKPGMGKSALVTCALKSFHDNLLKGKKARRFFLYYFRSYDARCHTRNFLEAAVQEIKNCYGLSCILPQDMSDQIQNFRQLLEQLSETLQPDKAEFIFVLDGLDEAISRGHQEMVSHIPFLTEAPGIRWLLTGRENCTNPFFDIKKLMVDKGVATMELGPMVTGDIISLLSASGAKYDLFQNEHREQMMELVISRSEGNPLYLTGLLEDLLSRRKKMELSDFNNLPKGVEGFFDEGMQRIGVVGQSQESKAILLTLAWAKQALPLQTIAEVSLQGFGTKKDTLPEWHGKIFKAVNRTIQFLTEGYAPDGTPVYSLYHEGLREYLHDKKDLAEDCRTALESLTDCLFHWKLLQGFTRLYSLTYTDAHLYQLHDSERMWHILKDEAFRQARLNELKQHHYTLEGLKYGITLYAEEAQHLFVNPAESSGATPDHIGRLAWLVLNYGESGERARTDVAIAWQWAAEGLMEDALKRLEFVDEEYFFKAVIYLLWIEADRMIEVLGEQEDYSKLPEEKTRPFSRNAQLVLDTLDKRIPYGSGIVDWDKFASLEFMSFWYGTVLIIPGVDVFKVVRHTTKKTPISALLLDIAKATGDKRHYNEALKIARCIEGESDKSQTLLEIAKALATKKYYNEALEVARGIENESDKSEALLEIAKATGDKRHYDEALEIARGIEYETSKSEALLKIAKALATENRFGKALEVARGIENFPGSWKYEAFLEIAWVTGDKRHYDEVFGAANVTENAWSFRIFQTLLETAKATGDKRQFDEAIEIARGINDEWYKSLVVKALVTMKHYGEALEIARGIEVGWCKSKALLDIAKATGDKRYYDEALEIARGIKNESSKSEALLKIAKATGEKRQFDEALEVARGIENERYYNPKPQALLKIVKALATANYYNEALEIARGIEDERSKSAALLEIIRALVTNRHYDEALEIARGIEGREHKSQAFLEIAKATGEKRYYNEALEIARGIEDERYYNPKPQALLKIVEALATAKYYNEALEIARGIEDERSKSAAFLEIAKVLTAERHYDEALDITRDIEYESSKSEALLEIAKATGEKRHYNEALEIARCIEDESSKSQALLEIAKALAAKKHYDEALEVARGIEAREYKSRAFLEITWVTGDKWYYDDTLEAAYGTDDDAWLFCKSQVLIAIAKATGEKRYYDEALEIARCIEDESSKSQALLEIAKATGDKRHYDEALKVALGIENERYKFEALLEVAKVLTMERHYDEALEIARGIEDESSKFEALLEIARATGDKRHYNEALEVTCDIEWGKSEAFLEIAKALANGKHYDEALKVALDIKAVWYKSQALLEIAKATGDKRHYDEALEVARGIEDKWVKPEALMEIAKALANGKRYNEALEVARGIEAREYKSEALLEIVKALATEKHKEALEIARGIEDESSRSKALLEIAKALAAKKHYNEALEIARGIEDESSRSKALLEIAKALAAKKHYNEALEIARGIEDESSKSQALLEIAKATGDKRYYNEALEVARGIEDKWYKSKALLEVAKATGDKRHYNEALKVARGIEDGWCKSEVLLEIARALTALKHYDEALEVARGIEDKSSKSQALLEIAGKTANLNVYEEAFKISSGLYVQSDKRFTLSTSIHVIATPDGFESLLKWYQHEQQDLSSETVEDLFEDLLWRIHNALKYPENLQVLLQWASFLPPLLETAYFWFSTLYCSFIRTHRTEYVDSIHAYCPQMGLQVSNVGRHIAERLRRKLENALIGIEELETQIRLETLLKLVKKGELAEDKFWIERAALLNERGFADPLEEA